MFIMYCTITIIYVQLTQHIELQWKGCSAQQIFTVKTFIKHTFYNQTALNEFLQNNIANHFPRSHQQ